MTACEASNIRNVRAARIAEGTAAFYTRFRHPMSLGDAVEAVKYARADEIAATRRRIEAEKTMQRIREESDTVPEETVEYVVRHDCCASCMAAVQERESQ